VHSSLVSLVFFPALLCVWGGEGGEGGDESVASASGGTGGGGDSAAMSEGGGGGAGADASPQFSAAELLALPGTRALPPPLGERHSNYTITH
jgi:hypothetical protein